jgi:hypothetical protein
MILNKELRKGLSEGMKIGQESADERVSHANTYQAEGQAVLTKAAVKKCLVSSIGKQPVWLKQKKTGAKSVEMVPMSSGTGRPDCRIGLCEP